MKDFVLDWDKALGFKGDPFQDKIFEPVGNYLVDRVDEKQKLNWFFIKGYFYGTIVGEHGVGKTMLLKWLEDRLKRYNRIHAVYINAAVFREQVNILQQMTQPLLSMYEKHITKPHTKSTNFDNLAFLKKKLGGKSIALLIDNAHNLTEKNLDLFKQLREEGLRFQVIVASSPGEYEKTRLGELGTDELNITLRRLTLLEAKEMLEKRFSGFGGSGQSIFNEEILRVLYDRADKNPRQFLHLCRDEAIRILIHKKDLHEREMITKAKLGKSDEDEEDYVPRPAVSKPQPKKGFLSIKFKKDEPSLPRFPSKLPEKKIENPHAKKFLPKKIQDIDTEQLLKELSDEFEK